MSETILPRDSTPVNNKPVHNALLKGFLLPRTLDTYQTRTEHSRNLEDASLYDSIDKLVQLGLFIRLSDLELYHGRAGSDNGWEVLEDFNNAGDLTGNMNINGRPTLYACDREHAIMFAKGRAQKTGVKKAAIHKIESSDIDSVVIDGDFDYSRLSAEELTECRRLLARLRLGLTSGSPLSFDTMDTNSADKIIDKMKTYSQDLIFFDDKIIKEISEVLNVDKETVINITSSANALRFFLTNPSRASRVFLRSNQKVVKVAVDNSHPDVPINNEYLANLFRVSGIVGVKHSIISATLGKQVSGVISLFDLKRIKASRQIDKEKRLGLQRYQVLSVSLSQELERCNLVDGFRALITNPYEKSKKLIDFVKDSNNDELSRIYSADAGNWEGYSLSEHTLTALTNFMVNYADEFPVQLLPVLKTAILVHDIGKPVAVAKGQKQHQDKYNAVFASKYLDIFGFNQTIKKFILGLIGQGMKLGHQIRVNHRYQLISELRAFAKDQLKQILPPTTNITKDMVDGYLEMIDAILVCDGGSYSSMAITTRNHTTRNAGSFNHSFNNPNDGPQRRIRFKGPRLSEL